MITLEQIVAICRLLKLSPVSYSVYIRNCVEDLVNVVGQAGIDEIEAILESAANLDEILQGYASDANSTLIQAETLKWSEGGRQSVAVNQRLDCTLRMGILLDIREDLRKGSSGQYAGFTPTFRG